MRVERALGAKARIWNCPNCGVINSYPIRKDTFCNEAERRIKYHCSRCGEQAEAILVPAEEDQWKK